MSVCRLSVYKQDNARADQDNRDWFAAAYIVLTPGEGSYQILEPSDHPLKVTGYVHIIYEGISGITLLLHSLLRFILISLGTNLIF